MKAKLRIAVLATMTAVGLGLVGVSTAQALPYTFPCGTYGAQSSQFSTGSCTYVEHSAHLYGSWYYGPLVTVKGQTSTAQGPFGTPDYYAPIWG